LAIKFAQLERYGFIILILLLFTGVLGAILSPVINLVFAAFSAIFS
jgi:hypothetical protein